MVSGASWPRSSRFSWCSRSSLLWPNGCVLAVSSIEVFCHGTIDRLRQSRRRCLPRLPLPPSAYLRRMRPRPLGSLARPTAVRQCVDARKLCASVSARASRVPSAPNAYGRARREFVNANVLVVRDLNAARRVDSFDSELHLDVGRSPEFALVRPLRTIRYRDSAGIHETVQCPKYASGNPCFVTDFVRN